MTKIHRILSVESLVQMIGISSSDDPSKSKEKLFDSSENSTRTRSELSSKDTRGGLANLPGFEILHISNCKQKSCICNYVVIEAEDSQRALSSSWFVAEFCIQVLRPEEHIGMSAVAFEGEKEGLL